MSTELSSEIEAEILKLPVEKREVARHHMKEKFLSFTIHDFREENYEMIKSWWIARGAPPALYEHLPPTGIVIALDGRAICAGFLFLTDANIGCIGNLVSDPKVQKDLRQPSIDFLVKFLTGRAKDRGYSMVVCSTNIPKLQDRFKALGFIETDKNVSQFGRIL